MNGNAPRTVASVQCGEHVCFPYDSDAEHEAVLAAFVVAGLERNERILYFSDTQPPESILAQLHGRGIDAMRHETQGRLSVATADASYLARGYFDPDACIAGWHDAAQAAVEDGYNGIRVVGDMGWATRGVPGAQFLLDYERRIQKEIFPTGLVTGMCEIDRRRFADSAVEALLCVHPDGAVRADTRLYDAGLQMLPIAEPFGAKVYGEIDAGTVGTFENALRELSCATASDIHIDFSAVRFMGANAMSALVRVSESLQGERSIVVLNMAPKFQKVLNAVDSRRVLRLGLPGDLGRSSA